MKKTLLFVFFIPTLLFSQPTLQPHIGQNTPPLLTDPICAISTFLGDFDTTGYAEGESVADFTLYKTNGDSIRLSDELMNGIPILLIGGNYTCPVFRGKITDINDMASYYAGQLKVYIVYGVEAHPIVDDSPYSGGVWVTSENFSEGVLYEQPDTYGERLELIDSLLANYSIIPEILVDGPCNEWWNNFGPAPNNAYLIDTTGVVMAKHAWFHRTPDNMWCDIDSLLGTNSGNCIFAGNNGTYDVILTTDSIVYDTPGAVLSVHATIHNLSSTDNVELNVLKQFIDIPAGWGTALCADVCYASSVSSINITIAPADSQEFVFYFYTSIVADSGYAKINFTNLNVSGNNLQQRYYGVTQEPSGISEMSKPVFTVFPNPANNTITIKSNIALSGESYNFTDGLGRIILSGKLAENQSTISIEQLPPGFYFLSFGSANAGTVKIIKQ